MINNILHVGGEDKMYRVLYGHCSVQLQLHEDD